MTESTAQLQLRFEPDTDGTGELFARVRRGEYSGAGSAWFGCDQVESFGQALRETYPIPAGTALELRGGYWKHGATPPELEDVLLGITVCQASSTGAVAVRVEVMDGRYEGQRQESRARLYLELQTDYQSLADFGVGIAQLVRVQGSTASLSANAA